MNAALLLSEANVQALGWMLVHFTWQGLVVAALLAVARIALKKPHLRYAAACASLLAIVLMPLGLAITVGFLGPLSVSLLNTRRAVDFVWPLLGFGGVYLLAPSTNNSDVTWQAIGVALAYAFTWALYILASARAGKSMRGLDGFTVASAIGALLLLPFGIGEASYFVTTSEMLMMTIVVTLLITIPLGMEFLALKRIEPRVFGVLLSTEPAIAAVIGILILNEYLSASSWAAITLVTAASIGVTFGRSDVTKSADEH